MFGNSFDQRKKWAITVCPVSIEFTLFLFLLIRNFLASIMARLLKEKIEFWRNETGLEKFNTGQVSY